MEDTQLIDLSEFSPAPKEQGTDCSQGAQQSSEIQITLSKEFKAPIIYLKAGNPRVRILHIAISL